MKLGIVADVHECLPNLNAALERLARERVDRTIFLGDLCETGQLLSEVVDLMERYHVEGVFGNHDMGLIVDPDPDFRARFPRRVLAFLDRLNDRLAIADCEFCHAQAWMDPRDFLQPWYLNGPPTCPDLLARNFEATSARVLFQAHYHRWLHGTPSGRTSWSGEHAITLAPPGRHLVLVHAVLDGWCASYSTETAVLVPIRVGPAYPAGA